jgi:hypothetical protein
MISRPANPRHRIDDFGPSNGWSRRRAGCVDKMPNKANFLRFWAKTAGGREKQSQSARSGRPRLGIADWGSGIRAGCRVRRVDGMSNKANPGRGGLGIDELWTVDDLRHEPPGAGTAGVRGSRYEIRAGRVDGAPNKANFGVFRTENGGAMQNKANFRGRGGRDCGLGIADWGFAYAGRGRFAGQVSCKADPRVAALLVMTEAGGGDEGREGVCGPSPGKKMTEFPVFSSTLPAGRTPAAL